MRTRLLFEIVAVVACVAAVGCEGASRSDEGNDGGDRADGPNVSHAVEVAATDGARIPSLPAPSLPPVEVDKLAFGAFGDVRPANPNDTASYPDAILGAVLTGLQAQGIVIAMDTGDHCFQSTIASGSYAHDQFVNHFMAQYMAHYGGRLFPTMGNHEGCAVNAATSGNCTTWTSGLVRDYLVDIVYPTTGQLSPYYSVVLHGPWGTAKFLHVAANAWTSAQGTWLEASLSVATNYTFVVRHEPSHDTRAPGVAPSEAMLASHFEGGTLTLSITGHTHLLQLPGGTMPYGGRYGTTKMYEVIIGNAGAPLDAGAYYGYAIVRRRGGDGAIVVQAYEAVEADGVTPLHDAQDPTFRFAVNANGTPNPGTSLP